MKNKIENIKKQDLKLTGSKKIFMMWTLLIII